MGNEIWKDVYGYEGLYQISNLGNVRSNYKLLTPQKTRFGYMKIRLSINNVRKGFFMHRLVAIAFIENKENKRCVNHKDGIKTNNNVDNLEWATHSENERHAYLNGLQPSKEGVKNGRCKLTELDIIEIRNTKKTLVELSSMYNVTPTAISNIKRYKLWKHIK
jgi:hypothetical protein